MTFGAGPSPWNEQRDAELRRLWDEGHSAKEIGRRMGGLTKSSVCGRAHRLKLPDRPSPLRPKGTSEKAARQGRAAAAEAALAKARSTLAEPAVRDVAEPKRTNAPAKSPAREPVGLQFGAGSATATASPPQRGMSRKLRLEPLGHNRGCQWIEDEKDHYSDADKCGRPKDSGPYCQAHRQRAWVSASEVRRQRKLATKLKARDGGVR